MTPEVLEQIQTKIAFLERANAELGDVVFRQQQDIRDLGARLQELTERWVAAQAEHGQRSLEDERPPHY